MDENDAIRCLTDHKGWKPSEIGKAVNVLYKIHGAYQEIVQQLELELSHSFLSSRHRIFKLPQGIRWKVDEGQISITQGYQTSRLSNEDDQWLLAIATVEKKLDATECKTVVDLVLNKNWTIRDALSTITGVRFEEISPPVLLLPVEVDFWFALTKSAWNRARIGKTFAIR